MEDQTLNFADAAVIMMMMQLAGMAGANSWHCCCPSQQMDQPLRAVGQTHMAISTNTHSALHTALSGINRSYISSILMGANGSTRETKPHAAASDCDS